MNNKNKIEGNKLNDIMFYQNFINPIVIILKSSIQIVRIEKMFETNREKIIFELSWQWIIEDTLICQQMTLEFNHPRQPVTAPRRFVIYRVTRWPSAIIFSWMNATGDESFKCTSRLNAAYAICFTRDHPFSLRDN